MNSDEEKTFLFSFINFLIQTSTSCHFRPSAQKNSNSDLLSGMLVRVPANGGRRIPKRKKLDRLESAQPTRSSQPPPTTLSPPQPAGSGRSIRVRGRRHGGAREESEGGGAGGHWRSMELDAREKEIAEALDLFKTRRDFEAEKESIERKLRELREREEELEMLGSYIEERRVRVRADEVEVEKKRRAVKAKEKEIKWKADELRYREEEFGKRLGELIVREERIEELESRVHDYEQRLSKLEMDLGCSKGPEVTLELQGMEIEIVHGFCDEIGQKGCGRNGKSKQKRKDKSMVSSSEQKKKEKKWFDAFARGFVENGQKERNGDAVGKEPESLAKEPVEMGHVNSVNDGLVQENNAAPEDEETECSDDVIDLASMKCKKVIGMIQSSLEDERKKPSADSVAELMKISGTSEDKFAECNDVINSGMAELSPQEKEAAEPSKDCSENLDSAEKQADRVESNGVGSIAATGSSAKEELEEMGSFESRIQDSIGEFDLQEEQLDVVVEENLGVTEKESGSVRAVSSCDAPTEKKLVDSVDDCLVKETSEGPKVRETEHGAVNSSASSNGDMIMNKTQLMCVAKSLLNEQPKEPSVDSFAELMTEKTEGNKDEGVECGSAVIKPSTTKECSAEENEPQLMKNSSTKLHPEEKRLDAVKRNRLEPTAATMSSSSQAAQCEDQIQDVNGELDLPRERLGLVAEQNPGPKEQDVGCAQERSVPTPDSQQLQVKNRTMRRMTKIDRLQLLCGGLKSLVNEQQKESSVDLVAAELSKERYVGTQDQRTKCGSTEINPVTTSDCPAKVEEPDSIATKFPSLENQFDEMCLAENRVQYGDGEGLENPGGVEEKESLRYPDMRLVSGRQLLKRFELKRKQQQFTSLGDCTKFCFSPLNWKEDLDSEKFLYWARSVPGKRLRKGHIDPADILSTANNSNGDRGAAEHNTNEKEKEPDLDENQQLEMTTLQSSIEAGQNQSDRHLSSVDDLSKSSNSDRPADTALEEKKPELDSTDKCATATKPLPEEKQPFAEKDNNVMHSTKTAATAPFSKRYESQKKRDWGTFLFYYSKILNHPASSTVPLCTGADVVAYLKHTDQFGKTKVHVASCADYGIQEKGSSCSCPLKQAWGSQDSLVGRLRAACEECGVDPKANPFGSKEVRAYLKGLKEEQDKARGTCFMKKRKRKKLPAATTTT